MRMISAMGTALLGFLWISSTVWGESQLQCDTSLAIRDVINQKLNDRQKLVLAHSVSETNYEEYKNNGTLSAITPAGVPIGLGINKYRESLRAFSDILDFQYVADKTENYIESIFPQNALNAYGKCLDAREREQSGVHAWFNVVDDKNATLTIKWRPPSGLLTGKLDVFPRDLSAKLPSHWTPDMTGTVLVCRGDKPLIVVATMNVFGEVAGVYTDQATLLPLPPEWKIIRHSNQTPDASVAVNPKPGEIRSDQEAQRESDVECSSKLEPNRFIDIDSVSLIATSSQAAPAFVAEVEPRNPSKVCVKVTATSRQGLVRGSAKITYDEIELVPQNEQPKGCALE